MKKFFMDNFQKIRQERIGQQFGTLIIVDWKQIKRKNNTTIYKAVCQCTCCNEIKIVEYNNLKNGSIISCGKLRGRKIKGSAEIRLFNEYKIRAKRRNINFDLTIEQFISIIKQNCSYCKYPPSLIKQS